MQTRRQPHSELGATPRKRRLCRGPSTSGPATVLLTSAFSARRQPFLLTRLRWYFWSILLPQHAAANHASFTRKWKAHFSFARTRAHLPVGLVSLRQRTFAGVHFASNDAGLTTPEGRNALLKGETRRATDSCDEKRESVTSALSISQALSASR